MSLNHSSSNNTVSSSTTSVSKNGIDTNHDVSQKILRAIEELKKGSGFG